MAFLETDLALLYDRERLLHGLLNPLAASRPALEMYEEHSFIRAPLLRTFLVEILESLSEFDFSLEASITSGIDWAGDLLI